MEIRSTHLNLTQVGLEAAHVLLLAFNGDERFNAWSGYPFGMTLAEVQADMQETLNLPEGDVWRIAGRTNTLVCIAETAFHPSPDTAWIALLIIMHAFQGQGYGSEVAAQLENYFFSYSHVTQIGLATLVQNTPAMAFWEKRGYVRGKRCHDTQGHDVYEYHLFR